MFNLDIRQCTPCDTLIVYTEKCVRLTDTTNAPGEPTLLISFLGVMRFQKTNQHPITKPSARFRRSEPPLPGC